MRILIFLLIINGAYAMTIKDKKELKNKLSPLQYKVTVQSGTEPPFNNEYWDNKKEGVYVDLIDGTPLFSSKDKYKSGSGWPSFTKPINDQAVKKQLDFKMIIPRSEIVGAKSGSHLGHVFSDGPEPSGQRYCMNSASLKFIPKEKLAEHGLEKFLEDFAPAAQLSKISAASIVLGGGCFWGVEEILKELKGVVLDTEVGYAGGIHPAPTYADVTGGTTGHAEVVKVTYADSPENLKKVLGYFFRLHDPTTLNQQGHDKGSHYRSIILFENEVQQKIAAEVKKEVETSKKWKKPLTTEIKKLPAFFKAEEHHQDYLDKKPNGYTCHFLRD